jgi:hypothetical protein
MENIYPKYLRNYQKEDIINQQKYDKWDEFVNDNKYKKYFIDNKENWYNKLQELKDFIDKKGRPKKNSKYKDEKKLAKWLSTQQIKYTKKIYIMIEKDIYDKWTEFVNDNKYKGYFIEIWYNKLQELKDFIDKKGIPNSRSTNQDEKILSSWLDTQQKNYTKKTYIMKEKYIYDKWTEFVNDDKYSKYFTKDDSKDDIKES